MTCVVFITAGQGPELGLNENNHLIVQEQHWSKTSTGVTMEVKSIDLGLLTDDRAENLKGYIDQLRSMVPVNQR